MVTLPAGSPATRGATRPVHLVVVPHTHWDREWYQPFQELRGWLVRLLEHLLDLLARDPAFTHFHLDGQTIVLEDYLEIRPERRAPLRRFIRSGRIAVGPWYVLPDEIAPLAQLIDRPRRDHGTLQTHRGELRSPLRTQVTPGITSVRGRLKQRDFANVGRLEHYAEPLATWADLLAGERQFGPFVDWAWKVAVQNHPHDSITGCSVDQVHRDMEARFDQVRLVLDQVLSQALAALLQRLDTAHVGAEAAVAVYNPPRRTRLPSRRSPPRPTPTRARCRPTPRWCAATIRTSC